MQIFLKIISILIILYGLSTSRHQSKSRFFIFWLVLASAGLILSELIRTELISRIPPPVRLTLICLLITGAAVFLVMIGLILSAFHERPLKHPDCLIVLGAQVRESGPSRVLAYRLDAAAAYLRDHTETVVVLSGGKGRTEPWTEAEGMEKYLKDQKLPEGIRIITEKESMSTRDNLRNCFRLTGDVPVAVVTSNFHMYRAKMLARDAGYSNVYGIAARSTPYYLPNNITRESLALIKSLFYILLNSFSCF